MSKELSGESEDDDVQYERNRILEQPQELLNDTVLIKELTKVILFNGQLIISFLLKSMSLASRAQCGLLNLCVLFQ